MGKIVGLTYDLRTEYIFKDSDPQDANAEFDHPTTIDVVEEAIRSGGHEVVRIGNAENLLKSLDRLKVDIVFNIAEGKSGRNREAQVPILLEMKGIPFVGADGLTLALTLDKVMTKKVLLAEGIPTPRFFEVADAKNLNGINIGFPLIVKPRYEGSSKGISESSVVKSRDELKKQAAWVIETYKQPALIEQFVAGSEFTVAIVGNDPPAALPVVQIRIDGKLDLGGLFYTFSRIHSNTLDYICPAQISGELEGRMQEIAIKVYKAVDCRDLGRVDIRLNAKGEPYVLEINPLPSLSSEDVFMVIANYMNISYNEMINKILDAGLRRYGLK